jgi:hypothetical protein
MTTAVDPSITVTFEVVASEATRLIWLFQYKVVDGVNYGDGMGYQAEVQNGGFMHLSGFIYPLSPGGYFPDEFAISGSFVSATRAEGEIEFATNGHVDGKTSFVATLD